MNHQVVGKIINDQQAKLDLLDKEYKMHQDHLENQIDWKDIKGSKAKKEVEDIVKQARSFTQKHRNILEEMKIIVQRAQKYSGN